MFGERKKKRKNINIRKANVVWRKDLMESIEGKPMADRKGPVKKKKREMYKKSDWQQLS
jgi:hypothetical protein